MAVSWLELQNKIELLKMELRAMREERDELKALGRLLELKFKSGNAVPVERVFITRAEYEEFLCSKKVVPEMRGWYQ